MTCDTHRLIRFWWLSGSRREYRKFFKEIFTIAIEIRAILGILPVTLSTNVYDIFEVCDVSLATNHFDFGADPDPNKFREFLTEFLPLRIWPIVRIFGNPNFDETFGGVKFVTSGLRVLLVHF